MEKNTSKNVEENRKKKDETEHSDSLNILDVDLIKGEKEKKLDWSKYIAFIFLTVVAASVLAFEVYWLIGWWEKQENKRTQEIEKNIKNIKEEISQLEAEYQTITELKIKADILEELLAHHPFWTNFFNWIERRTLSTVSWESFSADLSGSYSLNGEAKTFADISWQTRSFLDDKLVEAVNVNSGDGGLRQETRAIPGLFDEDDNPIMETYLESSVTFSLDLEISPTLFYRQ
jgi:hypothetical protein